MAADVTATANRHPQQQTQESQPAPPQTPPSDLQAERIVLSELLFHQDRWTLEDVSGLEPTDFFGRETFLTARSMWPLLQAGYADVGDVLIGIRASGHGAEVTAQWLMELSYEPACITMPRMAERVRQLSAQRRMAARVQALAIQAALPDADPTEIRAALRDVAEHETSTSLVSLGGCIDDALEMARRRCAKEELPIPVPWPDLAHQLSGGIWPGMHTLVAGTGFGKSQFEFQKAAYCAEQGIPVALVALELTREDIVLRMASAAVGVLWSHLATGRADLDTVERVRAKAESLRGLPIYVEEGAPGRWTADHLERLARRLRRRHPAGPLLMVVDYLQLCGGDERELRERVGNTAYRGREMARELGVAVELVSSVGRDKYGLVSSAVESAGLTFRRRKGTAGYRRVVTSPDTLVGLGKESGEIEFASDTVTVLVRWPGELDTGHRLILAVSSKVRFGRPGWSALTFDGGRFAHYPMRGPEDLPDAPKKGKPATPQGEYRERVLAVLSAHKVGSFNELCGRVAGRRDNLRAVLADLLNDGVVEKRDGTFCVVKPDEQSDEAAQ